MRDDHRPKQDIINELVGLRKQVADLKEAAVVRWRVEQAVRRSEEKYRQLVELAPGGLCRLDADGKIEHMNSVITQLLGCESRTEAQDFARTFGLFEDAGERRQLFAALDDQGEVSDMPVRLRRLGGGSITAAVSGRALRDSADALDGYILLFTATSDSEAPASQD